MKGNNSRTDKLRAYALNKGIELLGITSALPFEVEGKETRIINPEEILQGAQSVIVAGFYFYHELDIVPSKLGMPRGRFTQGSRAYMPMRRYCQKIIEKFLKKEGFKAVSSMKIPAKLAAVRAGLGKYGKNCVVLTEKGSWVMFESVVTDAPLEYGEYDIKSTICNNCTLCIDQCPTKAITGDYKLDRALCITNWLWGKFVLPELRYKQEDRLFGCGECLRVCPKNDKIHKESIRTELLENYSDSPELIPLVTGDKEYYKTVVPSFPRWAGIDVIRGNAIIALGNTGDPATIGVLEKSLQHTKPQIRAYSAWALGKLKQKKAKSVLEKTLLKEKSLKVLNEIKEAI